MTGEHKPHSERLWAWLGSTIPSGTIWYLYGRWTWQRHIGGCWLAWWGWLFLYSKSWRPWRPE